jgi:periplasmic protein TonB
MTSDLRLYSEMQEKKLRQRWYKRIPQSAQMKQGNVTIEFSIQRNGAITDQKIASGSGDIDLDQAALNAILQASPFSPLPSTTKMDHLRLRFNFQYNPAKTKGL